MSNISAVRERLAAGRTGETDPEGSEAAGSERKKKGSHRAKRKSPRSEKSLGMDASRKGGKTGAKKSAETEASEGVILLRLREEPDPSAELNKIPDADRLEALDPLSRYEYTIRAILQLERILGKGYSAVSSSPRDKDTPRTVNRSGRRNLEPGFLGTSSETVIGALAERYQF